ncbi:hypothetical protein DXG03_003504 [Asterophora parasitica]|uniref:GAR domain-containing protein n=1 Tax=Asterophora parasitica TaxID=117018 RepID=A0A9P7KEJ1_9AGAR|nr:hypothetical protein DXG03_003504 [Asterophora parasitica]
MDFPSIVTSTSDLALDPHALQNEIEYDLVNGTATPVYDARVNRDRRPGPPRGSGIVHLAIISAFLAPITLLPGVRILEQELNLSWREATSGKEEIQQLRGTIQKLLQGTEQQKVLSDQREARRSAFEDEVKNDLLTLLKETHAATLRALGTSLADVAAFMHEIELEMGMPSSRKKDQRGIDRLRSLALFMERIEPRPVPKSSGTAVAPTSDLPQSQPSVPHLSEGVPSTNLDTPAAGAEQALESHEVIELQSFSERKVWIEGKIKLLEKMPPIEVFVGLDAVRASAEHVIGLATRDELNRWIAEHDAIEKETEVFDRGELTKLRQLTKAATQRNLSPADTDVIELTLTTIYQLDKLIHLLRDRSENLELLGIRLGWEETRIAAWVDRRRIVEDLGTFLDTRARWNPTVYENPPEVEEHQELPHDFKRRSSVTSFASAASDTSVSSAGFSRSARFKLAELLSRDAAQFAGRVTSLRHGKITAAGKVLDKLIDHSRKPVPDELLDEQDRLEEKGIAEMENLGKFVMHMVMQWRKADEIYVETMKDKLSAQNLFEEIETAKLHHPTSRQSASFVSRADALLKRLAMRGNPTSLSSPFPCPEHPLFPDQKDFNKLLAQSLASEIASTTNVTHNVDATAKAYRAASDAVKRAETLTGQAQELSTTFSKILARIKEGVPGGDGDGSPPNLMSEACLEPTRHSTFLALLPSILQENVQAAQSSVQVLRNSLSATLGLEHPGIDAEFKANIADEFKRLESSKNEARAACDDVKARGIRLREARTIHGIMDADMNHLEDARTRFSDMMERKRWRQLSGDTKELLTPESPPTTPLPSETTHADLVEDIRQLRLHIDQEIDPPLLSLYETLEEPLKQWFSHRSSGLKISLEDTTKMVDLLKSIQRQATVMGIVHQEFNDIQLRIEDAKVRIEIRTDEVLTDELVNGSEAEAELQSGLDGARDEVAKFVIGLADRIPFVNRQTSSPTASPVINTRRFKLGQSSSVELPFNLAALDDAVRADSNAFVMRLNGQVEGLTQKLAHFHLARMAKELDSAMATTVDDIGRAHQDLACSKSALPDIVSRDEDTTVALRAILRDVRTSADHCRTQISRSFSPIRNLLRKMDASSGAFWYPILCTTRRKTVDDAEARFKAWDSDVSNFIDMLLHEQKVETERLEQLRIAEEKRQQVEKDRLAAEEAERLRLERERLEREERERLDAAQQAEAARQQAEKERIAVEEAERARLERERAEAEAQRRLEEERLANEKRVQAENDRIAAEKAEKAHLDRERLAMEEKLRLVEEQLAEERRLQVEKDRVAAEQLEAERIQQLLEEERRSKAESDRIAAEQHERQRLEQQLAEERRRQEEARLALEKAEHARQRAEAEARYRLDEERLTNQRGIAAEQERIKSESKELVRLAEHQRRQEDISAKEHASGTPKVKSRPLDEEGTVTSTGHRFDLSNPVCSDIFGLRVGPRENNSSRREMNDLQAQILAFRKRLRSMSVNEIARPKRSSARLPTLDQLKKLSKEFSNISSGVSLLPASVPDTSINMELRSLRADIEASADLMKRIEALAQLSDDVQKCDTALSDLLEHIDSYPAPPRGILSSSHQPLLDSPPEEQLAARLFFTRSAIESMTSMFAKVSSDSRAIQEKTRVLQTWSELEDMCHDRLGGRKSRPPSAISSRPSSGRNSSASVVNLRSAKKAAGYSNLSISSTSQKRLLVPNHPSPRRAVSGGAEPQSRSSSQLSNLSSNRAVSGGPLGPSIYGSTFASRQRTSSLSNSVSTPVRNPAVTPMRIRAQTAQQAASRAVSPTGSEASSYSRSTARAHTRSSTSMSTWSRAPRNSLSSLAPMLKNTTPQKKPATPPRKTYVADPKNKLDVAVGDVVNKLPVGINIEGVSETWKDQSGKYWIGNQDPKLCFCRILRSQTVMVRVGGGWSELSKFIKDHFADSFRLLPESPPRPGASEEKWISSATLLEPPMETDSPPAPPRTPEPTMPFVPTFALSTPSGQSPRSMKSASNSPSAKGSPLTPLQFMRRADVDAFLRPVTPSKPASTLRPRVTTTQTHTSNRNSIWRP